MNIPPPPCFTIWNFSLSTLYTLFQNFHFTYYIYYICDIQPILRLREIYFVVVKTFIGDNISQHCTSQPKIQNMKAFAVFSHRAPIYLLYS